MREFKFEYIYKRKEDGFILKMPLDLSWDFNSIKSFFDADALKNKYTLVDKRQFTGLYDRNKKPIYENDIVKWGDMEGYSNEAWHRYAKVELFPSLQFRIVFYVDGKTNEKKRGDNYAFQFGRFSYQETDKYLEVVGNIYENPEFLS